MANELERRRLLALEKKVAEMQADFVKNNLVARDVKLEQQVATMQKTFVKNNLLARVAALEAAQLKLTRK